MGKCYNAKNIHTLNEIGIKFAGPNEGDMACGEFGYGRMAEVDEILENIELHFGNKKLKGRHFIVTSGLLESHRPSSIYR